MKKRLLTLLLIFATLPVFAQSWLNVGNTLQRQPTSQGFKYRTNLGSPGFAYWYTLQQIDSLFSNVVHRTGDETIGGIKTFTSQFIAGQTMFNNTDGVGQLNNNIQFDLGNGLRAVNGSNIKFLNAANNYQHTFTEIGTNLYLINNDNTNAVIFTNDGNIKDASGNFFLKQGNAGTDTSISNNYVAKMPNKAGANITGTAGNGFVQLPSQSVSPASSTGNLRIYSDSLNRFSWKNSQHRRTIRVNRPIDQTITMPYRQNPIVADSTDVSTKYNSKLFILASDYLKGDSTTDNTIAARQMYTLAKSLKKMVWFDEGNYIFTDTVWVKVPTWGDGGKAPFNGTTGVTGNGLYKKGRSVLIQTTANKGLLYVNEHGIPIQGLTIKYTGSTNPTSGNGLEIAKGYSSLINNNYFEGFYNNLYVSSAVDAFFFNNQFVNPIKYNFYLGGDITDEGCNGVYQNMFNSSKSAIAEQFHADVPAGLRLHDNEFHIATGQAGPNYSKYAIYLNCIGSTSEPNVHHNGIEAYTEAGTYITVADTTVNLSKIMYNGNQSTSYSPNARDFVIISPGNIPHINGITAVDNFFGNTGPRAAVYMRNVDLITMNSNTYANGTTAYRDSLVNCTRVFTRVTGDLRLGNGYKYLGGEENGSKLTFQSSTSNTVPSTNTALEFFGGNGVNLATVTQGNMWGFGTTTPKSTVSINGGLAVGTYAGATAISTNNAAISGKLSVGTTLVGGTLNTANASGTDIFRSYLNVDGTLYHSIQDNFSATATGSYRLFLVGTGTANTTTPVLRLTGNGNAFFGANTIPTARIQIVAGTAAASTAPFKYTAGVAAQTTLENGAKNFDGNREYITANNVNQTLAFLSDLSAYAPLASPAFTGTPTAPTAAAGTNTTQLATTAFVQTATSGLIDNVLTKTASYTIVAGDFAAGKKTTLDLYVDASAGAVTITLPSASTFAGYTIYITKTDATANVITVNTVTGANTLTSQDQSRQFNSNATVWRNH